MGEKTEKNPKGAGRKPTGRTERIPFYVSKEEKAEIKNKAAKDGKSVTAWILGKLF